MKTLLVLLEHEDGIMQYLIDADEITYTTKAVCLMIEQRIVAYFRRDNVISISRYGKNVILSNGEVLEE